MIAGTILLYFTMKLHIGPGKVYNYFEKENRPGKKYFRFFLKITLRDDYPTTSSSVKDAYINVASANYKISMVLI